MLATKVSERLLQLRLQSSSSSFFGLTGRIPALQAAAAAAPVVLYPYHRRRLWPAIVFCLFFFLFSIFTRTFSTTFFTASLLLDIHSLQFVVNRFLFEVGGRFVLCVHLQLGFVLCTLVRFDSCVR